MLENEINASFINDVLCIFPPFKVLVNMEPLSTMFCKCFQLFTSFSNGFLCIFLFLMCLFLCMHSP